MYTLKPGWTKKRVMKRIKKYNNGTRAMSSELIVCLYQDQQGNRCAIGCFLPPDHISLTRRVGVGELLRDYPDLRAKMPFRDVAPLMSLQAAHDHAADQGVYASIEGFLDKNCIEAPLTAKPKSSSLVSKATSRKASK